MDAFDWYLFQLLWAQVARLRETKQDWLALQLGRELAIFYGPACLCVLKERVNQ